MQIGRRSIMVAGTFFLAAATGHVMQNADAINARLHGTAPIAQPEGLVQASLISASTETRQAAATAPEQGAAVIAAAVGRALPDFPDLPAVDPEPLPTHTWLAARLGEVTSDTVRPETMADRDYDSFGLVCAEPALSLVHLEPALLGLALTDPCHPGELVRISHAGMSFTGMTDDQGGYTATIPALAATGEVSVHLDSGRDLTAARLVPDLGSVARIALATRGPTGLHLSALLKGAEFGGPGHIHPENPGLPTLGLGGFLTRLGDPTLAQPVLAEVFTAPASKSDSQIEIVATVEAGNCGHDVLGTTFSQNGTVLPTTGAISFAMPDCDALGEVLVMNMVGATTAVTNAQSQP